MKSVNLKLTGLAFFLASLFSCGSNPLDGFNVEQRYWNANDYDNVLTKIEFNTPKGEKFPCYGSPKAPIFTKLVDMNNYTVVLDDKALGLAHREEFAKKMFENYEKMIELYSGTDSQDKFIYPLELADILIFGMDFQPRYFKTGNENILKEADDPKSDEVQRLVRDNEQTLIRNYAVDLDYINHESSFSPDALSKYTAAVNKYYTKLINDYPDHDFEALLSKAQLMLQKAQSAELKNVLNGIITLMNEKTKKE
jgi:hypothetical protein